MAGTPNWIHEEEVSAKSISYKKMKALVALTLLIAVTAVYSTPLSKLINLALFY